MRNYYYLTGPDGVGKTTFIKEVEKILQQNNINTTHIWLRSPKIFSKPLMAYCRLVGLTKRPVIDGIRYSKHEFYRSSWVSKVFPIIQLIDFKIKWILLKFKVNDGQTVLYDRFNIDTLADLMVDTKNMDLHRTNIGKRFLTFLPNFENVIILIVDENIIRKRKKDTLYDKHLGYKIKVYKQLSKDLNIKLVVNNGTLNETKDIILEKFGL